MSETSSATASRFDDLPEWARELSEKYYSGTFAVFVLHGNVRDLVPLRRPDGVRFLPLGEFLSDALFGLRDLVVLYDRGGGVRFARPDMQVDFQQALAGYDSFHGTSHAAAMPRNPDGVLRILDNYLRLRIASGKKLALVVDFAETITPAGEVGSLGAEDRNAQVMLKRWAQHPEFLGADVTIVLVTDNLGELNQGIVQQPGVAAIEVPLPDAPARREFVDTHLRTTPLPSGSEITPEVLVALGAGLKRVQLGSLVSNAVKNGRPLTVKFLSARKKELIEAEGGGMLEFVQSRFDLSMVAGHEAVKKKLTDAAAAIRAGRLDVLPMGYVICGAVGTGKTFLTTCFAGEVGIPAVVLKNFRSMWQGVTEGNLERILALLRAMSPIAVIVDEADAQLGTRESSGDSGVSNRVFAQIAQFMGNTELRGRVIWFLLTCRPDLLPVDLKRQGRAEEHLALFYPDSDDERLALFRAMQKKTRTHASSPDVERIFLEHAGNLSGADIEAILVRARMRNAAAAGDAVGGDDVKAVLADFIPPSYPTEIELQTIAAVLECTSKSLLPEAYREADRGELIARMQDLLILARRG
jgi:ATP-dependent 26S proteasome regulatory subunit